MDPMAMAPSMAMLSLSFGGGIALFTGVAASRDDSKKADAEALDALGLSQDDAEKDTKNDSSKSATGDLAKKASDAAKNVLSAGEKIKDKIASAIKAAIFSSWMSHLPGMGILGLAKSTSLPSLPGKLKFPGKLKLPGTLPKPSLALPKLPLNPGGLLGKLNPKKNNLENPNSPNVEDTNDSAVVTKSDADAAAASAPANQEQGKTGGGHARPIGTLMRALKRRYIGSKSKKR